MTDRPPDQAPLVARSALRTPRAAAVAGIVFSALLITALALLRVSAPADPAAAGAWLTDSGKRTAVAIGLNLIPFAGIAFLWFIGVIRDRIGAHEDRFFATVFLGSGLLFVGMMFVAAAVAGGLDASVSSSGPPGADTLALGRNVTSLLLNVYSMRMAAVFTLTTVTIARRTKIVSRWLTVAGIATALVLLVGIGISPWAELLFPAWILAISIEILAAGRGPPPAPQKRPPRADRRHWRDRLIQQPGREGPRLPANHATAMTPTSQAGSHVTQTGWTARPYSSSPTLGRAWLGPRAPGQRRGRR